MRKQNGDDVVNDRAVAESISPFECRQCAHILVVPIKTAGDKESLAIEFGQPMRDIGQRYWTVPRFLGSFVGCKFFSLYLKDLLMCEGAAAQALNRAIERCTCKDRASHMPPRILQACGNRQDGRREIDLGVAVDQRDCDVILDG